jgi:MFS family permease
MAGQAGARESSPTSAQADYAGGAYGRYVIGVLYVSWLLCYLHRQVISVLVPSLKLDLGLSDTEVSLLQGFAFSSCFAFAGLPLGHLADRLNRRNLIVAGMTIWTFATIACGLATDFGQLFLARMALGLGQACLAPASVSLMADYFRPEARGRAIGVMQSGTPVGSGLALFAGGLLLSALAAGGLPWAIEGWAPWRTVFLTLGAPALLAVGLAATVREPPRRRETAATAAGGLAALFRTSGLAIAVAISLFTCIFIHGYAINAWTATILMRVYGLSPAEAGAAYGTILLVCSAAGATTSGFLSDALVRRWPEDGRVRVALFLLPVLIPILVVFLSASSAVATLAAVGASSFVTGLISYSAFPVLQEITPGSLRGKVVAIYLLCANFVGLGLAPTIVALVTDYIFRDELMLQRSVGFVSIGACTIALVLSLVLPRLYRASRASPQVAI